MEYVSKSPKQTEKIGLKLAKNLKEKSLQRASDFDVSKIIKEWDFLEKNV